MRIWSEGTRVAYRPHGAADEEYGTVVGQGISYIYVRYDGDNHAKATHPDMLRIIEPDDRGDQS